MINIVQNFFVPSIKYSFFLFNSKCTGKEHPSHRCFGKKIILLKIFINMNFVF